MIQILGENPELFWSMQSGRVTEIQPSLPSALERRRTKGHWTQHTHRKSNLGRP